MFDADQKVAWSAPTAVVIPAEAGI